MAVQTLGAAHGTRNMPASAARRDSPRDAMRTWLLRGFDGEWCLLPYEL
jgi:hypothetical protein